jgi:hypothetical protein
MLCLGQLRDVPAGVLERDERPAAWQGNRILERSLPALAANGPYCRIGF